jgi:hypothetical protein
MGLALSVKRGDTPRSEVSDEVLNIVDSMSEKELRKYAGTSHTGLPKKVENIIREMIKEIYKEMKESVNEATTTIKTKDGKLHHYPNFKKNDVIKFLTKQGMKLVSNEKDLKSNKDFYIVESVNEAVSAMEGPWSLYVDGKKVKTFRSQRAAVKAQEEYTRKNSGWKEVTVKSDLYKEDKNKSINEAAKPSQVRSVISRVKNDLMKK